MKAGTQSVWSSQTTFSRRNEGGERTEKDILSLKIYQVKIELLINNTHRNWETGTYVVSLNFYSSHIPGLKLMMIYKINIDYMLYKNKYN